MSKPIFPIPLAILLAFMAVLSVSYLWLCTQCDSAKQTIERLSDGRESIRKRIEAHENGLTEEKPYSKTALYAIISAVEDACEINHHYSLLLPRNPEKQWSLIVNRLERIDSSYKEESRKLMSVLFKVERNLCAFSYENIIAAFVLGFLSSVVATLFLQRMAAFLKQRH
jgi:hypothetical protein